MGGREAPGGARVSTSVRESRREGPLAKSDVHSSRSKGITAAPFRVHRREMPCSRLGKAAHGLARIIIVLSGAGHLASLFSSGVHFHTLLDGWTRWRKLKGSPACTVP